MTGSSNAERPADGTDTETPRRRPRNSSNTRGAAVAVRTRAAATKALSPSSKMSWKALVFAASNGTTVAPLGDLVRDERYWTSLPDKGGLRKEALADLYAKTTSKLLREGRVYVEERPGELKRLPATGMKRNERGRDFGYRWNSQKQSIRLDLFAAAMSAGAATARKDECTYFAFWFSRTDVPRVECAGWNGIHFSKEGEEEYRASSCGSITEEGRGCSDQSHLVTSLSDEEVETFNFSSACLGAPGSNTKASSAFVLRSVTDGLTHGAGSKLAAKTAENEARNRCTFVASDRLPPPTRRVLFPRSTRGKFLTLALHSVRSSSRNNASTAATTATVSASEAVAAASSSLLKTKRPRPTHLLGEACFPSPVPSREERSAMIRSMMEPHELAEVYREFRFSGHDGGRSP